MSESLAAIKKCCDEAAKIIKNIDEIAYQTGILALNAGLRPPREIEESKNGRDDTPTAPFVFRPAPIIATPQ